MNADGGPRTSPLRGSEPTPTPSEVGIDLYWIPLGAGGNGFVRLNGRLYEAVKALLERRRPFDLYHTALEVQVPDARFTIETAWPIPDGDGAARGVVVEGPVGSHRIARLRAFRYEVRCWHNGVIPDAAEAVASPQRLSSDPEKARRLLDLTSSVPGFVWGRDELGIGEMWNSNSVISWLLVRAGLSTEGVRPPADGRAPGWRAGIVTARRQSHSHSETAGSSERESSHSPVLRAGRSTAQPSRGSG